MPFPQLKTTDISNTALDISKCLKLEDIVWVDVRTPKEYKKGHIPNAVNIPIFTNLEHSEVGKTYKEEGREKAIDIGIEFAEKSKNKILHKINTIKDKKLMIYCARGGMRSEGFSIILFQEGKETNRVIGGYKAYRNHVLDSFDDQKKIIILGGKTGSGKTNIISALSLKKTQTLDLENIANHRGSAFGDLGLGEQPTQQQFENNLSMNWIKLNAKEPIIIESESRTIGRLVLPKGLWNQMESSKYIFLDLELDYRIKTIVDEYGDFTPNELTERVQKIEKRLGGQISKKIIKMIQGNNYTEACRILMDKYYDKPYTHSYENRKSEKLIITGNNQEEILREFEKECLVY